jgi:aspartate/methionine/tyrosine aminotransferase
MIKLIKPYFPPFIMIEINPQAIELNENIQLNNKVVLDLLSGRGKSIFFPKKGILSQTADAKGKKLDATIGIALEENLTPMRLKPLFKLIRKLNPKDIFPYASSFGKLELREKWKFMIQQKNSSLKSEFSLPIVTNALTHGLSIISYLFITPGDKIITPDLFWENYRLIFSNTYGGILDIFQTFKDQEFNLQGLKDKLDEEGEKKILLLNFPNNPTGYTPTENEVDQITDIIKNAAEKKKILVIIDDAYFGLVYKEGIYKESIFSKIADLHENVLAIKVDGATKEDYSWGLRVGFVTFGIKKGNKELYEALENKTAGAIRATISNVSNLSQSLLLQTYDSNRYEKEKEKKYNLLKQRYLEVKRVLQNEKYERFFKALPYNSGYFMCIRLKGLDAEKLRQSLLKKYDTGVIAIKNMVRLAYSSIPKKDIKKLFENIYDACEEIK